jgi:hypothetical protein
MQGKVAQANICDFLHYLNVVREFERPDQELGVEVPDRVTQARQIKVQEPEKR